MLNHPGFHGIVDNVSAVIEEPFFLFHQPCFIAPLQYRPHALIFPVVELTVELVHLFHPWDHVGVRCLKQNVALGALVAVGMTDPVVFLNDPL